MLLTTCFFLYQKLRRYRNSFQRTNEKIGTNVIYNVEVEENTGSIMPVTGCSSEFGQAQQAETPRSLAQFSQRIFRFSETCRQFFLQIFYFSLLLFFLLIFLASPVGIG